MSARADNIVSHFNFQTEKLRETSCNGLHRKLGINLSFRSAEMRAKDNLGSVLYKILNCGKRSYYSLVACYNAVSILTLKSQRTRTLLPLTSKSSTVILFKALLIFTSFRLLINIFHLVYFITNLDFFQVSLWIMDRKY